MLGGETPDTGPRLDALRREAHRILNLYALSEDRYEKLWKQLDVAYFLRNDAADRARARQDGVRRCRHHRRRHEAAVVTALRRLVAAGRSLIRRPH